MKKFLPYIIIVILLIVIVGAYIFMNNIAVNMPNINDNDSKDNNFFNNQEISDKYIIGEDNNKYYIKMDEENNQIVIMNNNLDIISPEVSLYNCNNIIDYLGFVYIYPFGNVELEDDSIWYDNTLGINTDSTLYDSINKKIPISVKIEDNKIYFLMPILNLIEDETILNLNYDDFGVLEERVYTINNNKLEYEVINTYEITSVSSTC